MEKQSAQKLLTQFNNLYKELDDIYHSLARHYGLSDCAFWILYTMQETDESRTQSQLGEMLSLSRQTINSALKNLEAAGYIQLAPVAGNHKSKRILLTDAGKRFAEQTTDRVVQMELRAFDQFSAEEQVVFFRLLTAYVRRLSTETQEILGADGAGGAYEDHHD